MNETSQSLLLQVGEGDAAAWRRFDALYRPFIRAALLRLHVHLQDVDDLTQDILLAVSQHIHRFQHQGRTGSFRSWLRTITANRTKEFWRSSRLRATIDGAAFLRAVEGLEDPASSVSSAWDHAHQAAILRQLLESLVSEFEPRSMQAFRMLLFEGRSGAETAAALGMTVAGVYAAKSRILSRLRTEAGDLLD